MRHNLSGGARATHGVVDQLDQPDHRLMMWLHMGLLVINVHILLPLMPSGIDVVVDLMDDEFLASLA